MWNIRKIIKKGEYLYALIPEHPKATKNNYVYLHRAIMENHLERQLNDDEVVHHKNENKHDNRLENLEVMLVGDHERFHHNKNGHAMLKLKCPWCEKIFEKRKNKTHVSNKGTYTACSISCRSKIARKIQISGIDDQLKGKFTSNIIEEYIGYNV